MSKADVIQNKLNVLLANQQRLLSSWLPPRTAEELANAKSAEQIEAEEDAIFAPVPATLGVGATPPVEGEASRRQLSANDRLRKTFLGGASGRIRRDDGHQYPSLPHAPKRSRSQAAPREESDDEEGEGRSSLGRMKRFPSGGTPTPAPNEAESGDKRPKPVEMGKRPATYLDEYLAARSARPRKKKKRSKVKGGLSNGRPKTTAGLPG